MSLDYRFVRIKVGIISLIIYSLLANAFWLADALVYALSNGIDGDEITAYEMRFKELKEILPPNVVVGYITDGKLSDEAFYLIPPGNKYFQSDAVLRYHLAQYALSPIIVDNTTERELIVGNFRTSNAVSPVRDIVLLKDFGNGVMLFRRGLR